MMLKPALAAALAVIAVPAVACSVAPGYRVPTTLDLVREADVIVIAYPRQGQTGRAAPDNVQFVGAQILKDDDVKRGEAAQILVTVPGMLATRDAPAVPSDPDELARANPQAYAGACNRYIFAADVPVLLFLKRTGDGYAAISHPFARTAEDAPGIRSRWARAVREYVAIAALPRAMQPARLAARRDLLRAKPDAESRAIAADVDRELAGPRAPLREPLPPAPN